MEKKKWETGQKKAHDNLHARMDSKEKNNLYRLEGERWKWRGHAAD